MIMCPCFPFVCVRACVLSDYFCVCRVFVARFCQCDCVMIVVFITHVHTFMCVSGCGFRCECVHLNLLQHRSVQLKKLCFVGVCGTNQLHRQRHRSSYAV
eukprot:GHVR01010789.1.p1 GENE.GHVR01010789.1~~GHVR01010789.1.p1  ORF type:complete len:100 (-),score=14.92 GHVR01010789.1:769-1068(-)